MKGGSRSGESVTLVKRGPIIIIIIISTSIIFIITIYYYSWLAGGVRAG
jgi:hypothetical protein